MTVLRKPPVQGEDVRNRVLYRTVTVNTPAIDEEATDGEEFSQGFDGQDRRLNTLRRLKEIGGLLTILYTRN